MSHAHTGTARIGPLPHTARRHKRREGRAVGRDAHECKYMLPALPLYPLLYLRGPWLLSGPAPCIGCLCPLPGLLLRQPWAPQRAVPGAVRPGHDLLPPRLELLCPRGLASVACPLRRVLAVDALRGEGARHLPSHAAGGLRNCPTLLPPRAGPCRPHRLWRGAAPVVAAGLLVVAAGAWHVCGGGGGGGHAGRGPRTHRRVARPHTHVERPRDPGRPPVVQTPIHACRKTDARGGELGQQHGIMWPMGTIGYAV